MSREKLPPDMARERPMCMNQYKNQYGVTRVPGEKADTIQGTYPCPATFITVSVRNKLFSVPVMNSAGERASVKEIKRLLYEASKNSLEAPAQDPIGVLTAGHRDTWYSAYKTLSADPVNATNLKAIQDSLFLVCLDDYSLKKNIDVAHHQIFHGVNAENRWFDKAIQLIVTSNGRAGVNGEVFLFLNCTFQKRGTNLLVYFAAHSRGCRYPRKNDGLYLHSESKHGRFSRRYRSPWANSFGIHREWVSQEMYFRVQGNGPCLDQGHCECSLPAWYVRIQIHQRSW